MLFAVLAILSQHITDAAPQLRTFGRTFGGLGGLRPGFGGFRPGFGGFRPGFGGLGGFGGRPFGLSGFGGPGFFG